MKFTILSTRFNKLVNKVSKGKKIKPQKLEKLQQLLSEKKSRYEAKLASTQDPEKRKSLEIKLKVVSAQLEKSYHIGGQN
jgi:hypothetical protein